jgi:phosphoserine phosphatase
MRWPPYEHVFFDCDSTLTAVEGIDILAESVGKKWRVEVLTNAAMDGKLDLEEVYAKRLRAIRPTHKQIVQIRRDYKRHVVEDAKELIATLHTLGHKVYIISGGLLEPVQQFGIYLGVPKERIRAVDVAYDQLSGDWWDSDGVDSGTKNEKYMNFDEGALTISDGKAQIVQELRGAASGKSLLIGDGSSDLLASRAVDLFVGYGGVVARERVLAEAPVFLHSRSLAPLLPLIAGPAACRAARNQPYEPLFKKGLQLIETGAITFKDERLNQKFRSALDARQ